MNLLTILAVMAVPVAALLAYFWVHASRAAPEPASAAKQPQWRQSQLEPDTQAGRI